MTAAAFASMSAGGVRVNFDSNPYAATAIGSTQFRVNRDGTIGGDGMASADWAHPKFSNVGDLYEVKLTTVSGGTNMTGSTLGAYLALSTNQAWNKTAVGTFTGTLVIRLVGQADLASCSVTIQDTP